MNRKLWENMASLMSVQALNYVLPLFTLPFLARTLGPSHWGGLAFAEGYASYVSLVIEFGFGLSASRDIARLQGDRQECSNYLSNVLASQCILAVIMFSLTAVAFILPGEISVYRSLLPIAMIMAFTRALFPGWLFQGMERMKLIAIINFTSNTIAAASLFIFVKSKEDAWKVLTIRTAGSALSLVLAVALAYKILHFTRPSFQGMWHSAKAAFPLFLFRGLVSLYTTANVLLLGMISTPLVLAWFAGSERFTKIAVTAIGPITQTFYPRINYLLKSNPAAAAKTARLSSFLTIGAGLLIGLVLLLFAPFLVHTLLGKGFDAVVPVLRIMSVLVPLIAASQVFGLQWMISLKMEKVYSLIILFAGIVNILLALVLVPRLGAIGMAISIVIAETIVTGGALIYLHIKRSGPWVQQSEQKIAA